MPHMWEYVSYMETLKRHLGSHQNNTLNCPNCKYASPRKDALKRHSKKHRRTECRSLTANNYHQTITNDSQSSRIETKAYQADPANVDSYLYQQSLPKNKEIFLWIIHQLDTQSRRPSRPYNLLELIIIPQETDEKLSDPRELASISSEIDHLLNQEYEISASLSELDLILRQLE